MTINTQHLITLRKYMQDNGVDLYLVPNSDPHNNEIPPQCWSRRSWISQFNGSAGEALITHDHAYLWTDGRYFLQASEQLDPTNFSLMKQQAFTPETEAWLTHNARGKKLGVDPHTVGIKRALHLENIMQSIGGQVKYINQNLVDQSKLLHNELANAPCSQTFIRDEKYSGESIADKLSWLVQQLQAKKIDYMVLNILDEIAWLLNIRAGDIANTPLLISYLIIGVDSATLFVDSRKLPKKVVDYLAINKVKICEYTDFATSLQQLDGSIWLDDKSSSMWMYENIRINQQAEIHLDKLPIVWRKACKNIVEAQGARDVHVRDAVAVINYFSWLDNNIDHQVDEISGSDKLYEFRSMQEGFLSLSFDTISGFGANGAIIHYRATEDSKVVLGTNSLYLLDSGSQYLEGTTDTTRTIHLGTPTAVQKQHYTLVLKGHLAMANVVFPQGTYGEHIDVMARVALWNNYLNYRHGTGHGVGSSLSVHEGPQKISQVATNVELTPGMVLSNEPGFYLEGEYGIRIENLMLVVEEDESTARNSEYGPFYKFEQLTLLPYCKKLIDISLLTDIEIKQIRQYYVIIRAKVLPLLHGDAKTWLESELDF